MASSYLSPRTPREARRRTASLLLAIAAHLLVIALLLTLSPPPLPTSDKQPSLSTFDVASEPGSKPKAEEHRKTLAKAHDAKAAAQPRAERQPQPTEQPPSPTPPVDLHLFGRHSALAGVDIGKVHSPPAEGEVADSGAGSGRNSGSVYGPGAGPGGARLYNVDWVRHPTHAEINGYMPREGVPPGAWAEIACRTIPGNQVDNCRSLGESPAGSGLARGLRQAAWQFRIYPPRIDDKPLLGVWVRIHLDFTDKARDGDE